MFVLALGFVQCYGQMPAPIEIAPGVSLPAQSDATVFCLDSVDGKSLLVRIPPHEVVLGTNPLSNALSTVMRATAEVDGVKSETSISSPSTVCFVRLTGDVEFTRNRIHLLALEATRKRRQITYFSMNVLGGHRKRNMYEVPADIEVITGSMWVKITPKAPLIPGEFAIAFLPKDPNQQPDLVYDFTVPDSTNPSNSAAKSAPPPAQKN